MKLYNVLTIVTPLLGFGLAHLAPGDFYPGQITGPLDGAYSDFKEVLDLAANLTSKNAEKNVGAIVEILDKTGENLKRIADSWAAQILETDTEDYFDKHGQAVLFPHWKRFIGGAISTLGEIVFKSKHVSGIDDSLTLRRVLAGLASSESYLSYELSKILPSFAKDIGQDREGITWLVSRVLEVVKPKDWNAAEDVKRVRLQVELK